MATISAQEILVSELPTKYVAAPTLDTSILILVQPGQNEVTFYGLDPSVDVDSIRIEGTGPATVTDIQTQIVPRRESFTDVYSDDPDSESSSGNDEDPDIDSKFDDSELQSVRNKIAQAQATQANATNNRAMAVSMLEFLDGYGKAMRPETTDLTKVNDFLQLYMGQRSEASERHHKAEVELREIEKELELLQKKQELLESKQRKAQDAALKEVRRSRAKLKRERAQKRAERMRKRNERRMFFTADIGQVVVYLDGHSSSTPGSSRRSSIMDKPLVEHSGSISEPANVTLSLSYVVPWASWTPRYELSINTPSSTARMAYRAEFRNSSTETWRDTRVTLSNSQASFSGLQERIPSLQPWHIQLDTTCKENKDQPSWGRILRGGGETADYQTRVMLLEQRKRELLQERQRQASIQAPPPAASGDLAVSQLFRQSQNASLPAAPQNQWGVFSDPSCPNREVSHLHKQTSQQLQGVFSEPEDPNRGVSHLHKHTSKQLQGVFSDSEDPNR
ncbi:hypothetical protein EYZ11_006310 [Aspergillus tanneri]|uniref:DUF4140 domain-containing protein n=1 Tax=Aspergillus tanneri TaxID=1220188 RepID=A0A4S3JLN4_9EURO|nr:hypothetical protein EYZ11_006310 [Aspergillus tanneri]